MIAILSARAHYENLFVFDPLVNPKYVALIGMIEKQMREVDTTEEKRTTDIYSIIRLTFLMLAFIFLVAAAFLQGKEHIGTQFVLIITGACMLTASMTIFLFKRAPEKQSRL